MKLLYMRGLVDKLMNSYFLFDFDGTLTKKEVLPEIAKLCKENDRIRELTDKTISGQISFVDSFSERVNILGHLEPGLVNEVIQQIPIFEELLEFILSNLNRCAVVTNNLDIWVKPFLDSLKIVNFCSIGKYESGRTQIVKINKKEDALKDYSNYFTVYTGDGANDAQIMRSCNLGIASNIIHNVPKNLLSVANLVVSSERTLCKILNQLS